MMQRETKIFPDNIRKKHNQRALAGFLFGHQRKGKGITACMYKANGRAGQDREDRVSKEIVEIIINHDDSHEDNYGEENG